MGAIIGDIFEGIANALIGWLQSWLDLRAAKKAGADAQAAKETAASLKTEQAVVQAEADGPSDISEAIQRAKDGKI